MYFSRVLTVEEKKDSNQKYYPSMLPNNNNPSERAKRVSEGRKGPNRPRTRGRCASVKDR